MAAKKKSSSKKKTWETTKRTLIVIVVMAVLLFAGDQLGLVKVDWTEFRNWAVVSLGGEVPATPTVMVTAAAETTQSEATEVQSAQAVASDTSSIDGSWYQLYFNSPQYPDEPETRNHEIEEALIEVINSAQSSLDIAIYELDLESVGDAILEAVDRGVNVRIVTDTDTMEEDETLIRLDEEGIPMVPDDRGPIMHNKFMVVDGKAVWTGSYNFTHNGTFRNNNNAIYIQSVELAQNYAAEFEEMFTDKEFGPTSPANTPNPQVMVDGTLIETCFAAEDECAVKLESVIAEAEKSIYFMAFSFTHDGIGEAVTDRAIEAGVEVHGVFETRGSETEYSEYGRMSRMRKVEPDVVQDGNPYVLHHKVFIIDGETVITGSYNFSSNADESNDENILIIHNAEIAQAYLKEFHKVYDQALNPPNKED